MDQKEYSENMEQSEESNIIVGDSEVPEPTHNRTRYNLRPRKRKHYMKKFKRILKKKPIEKHEKERNHQPKLSKDTMWKRLRNQLKNKKKVSKEVNGM